LKSYVFRVVVEPDEFEDGTPAFHAYCPSLNGARTYGKTQEEALENIRTVVKMVVDEMVEEGKQIPKDAIVVETDSATVMVSV
jgi:predicted RNase H-like HicB family nuclease